MTPKELQSLIGIKRRLSNPAGESAICVEFVNRLKDLTFDGILKAVWLHVANEWIGEKRPLYGMLLGAMGKIAGCPDYVFLWNGGCGFIEVKIPGGELSPTQKLFKKWCEYAGVKHEVIYSADEGIAVLNRWGLVPKDSSEKIFDNLMLDDDDYE
jgi:hypothetical protein